MGLCPCSSFSGLGGRSGTENGGADTHDGAAGGHRLFQVRGHAHGQRVHGDALDIQSVPQDAKFGEEPGGVGGGRRYGHESPQPQPGKSAHLPGEIFHLFRFDTALARLAGLVDLNAHVQRWCAVRALIVEPPGDADAVQGMDPLEALGHFAALVGLKLADEVPVNGQ